MYNIIVYNNDTRIVKTRCFGFYTYYFNIICFASRPRLRVFNQHNVYKRHDNITAIDVR